MGLFGFAKSFIGVSAGGDFQDYSLEEYGTAAAYWSSGNSRTLFDSVVQIPHVHEQETSLIARIENHPRSAEIVFIGLYAAAYLVYATRQLGFTSERERDELIAGLNAGFVKLCSGAGSDEESSTAVTNFMASVSLFCPAIIRDFYLGESKQEEIYLMAIKLFEKLHGVEYETTEATILEQMRLHDVFEGVPVTLIEMVGKLSERVGNKVRFRLEG